MRAENKLVVFVFRATYIYRSIYPKVRAKNKVAILFIFFFLLLFSSFSFFPSAYRKSVQRPYAVCISCLLTPLLGRPVYLVPKSVLTLDFLFVRGGREKRGNESAGRLQQAERNQKIWWGDGACAAADESGERESIFSLTHTNEFVGACRSAPEPTPACCGVNQCRRVYEREGKKTKPLRGGCRAGLGTSFLGGRSSVRSTIFSA